MFKKARIIRNQGENMTLHGTYLSNLKAHKGNCQEVLC